MKLNNLKHQFDKNFIDSHMQMNRIYIKFKMKYIYIIPAMTLANL